MEILEKESALGLFNEHVQSCNLNRLKMVQSDLKNCSVEILSKDNLRIHAKITYGTYFSYLVVLEQTGNVLSPSCTCSSYRWQECHHSTILALYVLRNPTILKDFYITSISREEDNWLKTLEEEPLASSVKNSDAFLAYILIPNQEMPPAVALEFSSLKQKKNKEFKAGLTKTYAIGQLYDWPDSIKKSLSSEDWEVLQVVLQSKLRAGEPSFLIKKLIKTGRCFFKAVESTALVWGEERQASFEWNYDGQGKQTIRFTLEPGVDCFFFNTEVVYIDSTKKTCGLLKLPISSSGAKKLLAGPPIQTRKSPLIREKLASILKAVPVKEKPFIVLSKIDPVPHLSLDVKEDGYDNVIEGRLSFLYKDAKVSYGREMGSATVVTTTDAVYQVERDLAKEGKARALLEEYGFELAHYNSSVFNFYEDGHLNGITADLLQGFVNPRKLDGWKFSFSNAFTFQNIHEVDEWYADTLESGEDWFDLELGSIIDGKRVNLIPSLREILRILSQKNIILENLSEEELQQKVIVSVSKTDAILIPLSRLKTIFGAFFGLLEGNEGEDKLKLSKWDAPVLGELQEGMGEKLAWQAPKQYEQLKEILRRTKKIELVSPPKGLQCELRSYQLEGVSWLQFLRASNLAGILADDMGLGKTIQTLAHILIEKESGRMDKPALVIAPTTLMGNWLKEAARFAPELKVLILQGDERKKHFDTIYQNDLVLTTYPLLARDQDVLLKHEFHLLILDEAQNIKNAKTQAHHTIRKIQAKHKLCLTGTPIENHLGELWSFFHLLLPGFLGDEKQFQRVFRKPIEKEGSLERKKILQKRIHPFMLRRTKGEVALDLPPKTEIITPLDLSEKQKDLYEAVRLTMMKKVLSEVESKGLARSQIIVLAALLNLRQICCDPRLLKNTTVELTMQDSAKLAYLMEFIPQLLQEKRQILLFSQFTSMLALIEEELKALSIPYAMITGDTKDRITPVEEFQAGTKSLMLISLKAGGTGLNLTAADTVIHYDPWWNPAVENQATDRAHRIGQTKPVFVYKFVATGSIEEKILSLQGRKKEMAEGLFDSSNTKPLEMNLEDLHSLFAPLEV
ncbi:MAG: DEAD/DEAH box helicase [Chlamydiota bacterium]